MRKRTIAVVVSSLLLASAAAWAAVVTQDGGFESGVPNSFWDESSSNFGTVLCTVGSCGTGRGSRPGHGTWGGWWGGTTVRGVGRAGQTMVIPSGTATLTFWLEARVASNNPNDFLAVSIDNSELFRLRGDETAPYANYAQVTIDVSAFADGNSHTLKFDSTKVAGGSMNFFVDDVELNVDETITCADQGYTGTKLTWCKNICEMGYEGATLDMWIHRWVNRYRDLPACARNDGEEEPMPE